MPMKYIFNVIVARAQTKWTVSEIEPQTSSEEERTLNGSKWNPLRNRSSRKSCKLGQFATNARLKIVPMKKNKTKTCRRVVQTKMRGKLADLTRSVRDKNTASQSPQSTTN